MGCLECMLASGTYALSPSSLTLIRKSLTSEPESLASSVMFKVEIKLAAEFFFFFSTTDEG